MRLMALDLGEKRIGIAVSDPEGKMAFPVQVLVRRSAKADRRALAELVSTLGVERVIIGLPLSLEGEFGPSAQTAQRFGEYVARVLPVPVEYWDERMTTLAADELLRQAGLPEAERRERIDAAAATVILEDYLEAHRA